MALASEYSMQGREIGGVWARSQWSQSLVLSEAGWREGLLVASERLLSGASRLNCGLATWLDAIGRSPLGSAGL